MIKIKPYKVDVWFYVHPPPLFPDNLSFYRMTALFMVTTPYKCFIYCLTATLCMTSMVLTANFAVSFSNQNSKEVELLQFGTGLMVTIGVALDLSKYVFWGAQIDRWGSTLKCLAVVLTLFSWLASVAFFVVSEQQKVNHYRLSTAEYKGYLAQLDALERDIQSKREMATKRLGSRYHDQWDMSQTLVDEVQALQNRKVALLLTEPTVGISQANANVASTALFVSMSETFSIDPTTVRNSCYAGLALLIELCALGLISVCGSLTPTSGEERYVRGVGASTDDVYDNEFISTTGNSDREEKFNEGLVALADKISGDKEHRLVRDLLTGEIQPTFNKIKSANYGISHGRIRELLQELKNEGCLIEGPRRSLKLV